MDFQIAPVTPGELLKEEFLEPMGISQYRLAKETGIPGGLRHRGREAPPRAGAREDSPLEQGRGSLAVLLRCAEKRARRTETALA